MSILVQVPLTQVVVVLIYQIIGSILLGMLFLILASFCIVLILQHLKLQRTLQISRGFTLKVYLYYPRVLLEIHVRPLLSLIFLLFSTTDQSSNNSLLSTQSSPLTTPLSSHSPIPQQSPSSYSTTDPPLSLIVDLTHYPTQLNVASSTSTSPPQIHLMQLRSSTMQKRHACLSTKAKNYLITEPQTFTQAKPYAE